MIKTARLRDCIREALLIVKRRFAIIEHLEENFLLLCQYLDLGWPDAYIKECNIEDIASDEELRSSDAIILSGFNHTDEAVLKLFEQSENGNLPLIILLSTSQDTEFSRNILPLQGLTASALNATVAEGMKRRSESDRKSTYSSQQPPEPAAAQCADSEILMGQIPGLRGYRLMRELGRGGMSRVYLAERSSDGVEVAVKVLDVDNTSDSRMIERFIREYKMLASIKNTHVARIFDQKFTDEYAFIVMEKFSGGNLTHRIRRGIAPDKALDYVQQIADGLSNVHREEIVHRDLKPGNILFRADDTLAILDFGLARMAIEEDLSEHGEVYGTPSYVSPEQARGRRIDGRSDIYSLGIIYYQMLTGEKPYRADNPMAMFYKHVHSAIPKLREPYQKYQPLLEKMLAKSVNNRFQSAAELIEAIPKFR